MEIIKGSLIGDLKELDEYKEQFDLISLNMVIHHLDTDYKTYPNMKLMLKNLFSLLKPEGIICINHCYKEN